MNTNGKYKRKIILLGACSNSPRRPDTPRFTVRTLGNTASNPKKHRSGGDAVFALTGPDNKPQTARTDSDVVTNYANRPVHH